VKRAIVVAACVPILLVTAWWTLALVFAGPMPNGCALPSRRSMRWARWRSESRPWIVRSASTNCERDWIFDHNSWASPSERDPGEPQCRL